MGRDQTEGLPFNPITDHHVHFGLGWDGVRQGGLAAVGVTAWYKAGDADHYHSLLIVAPEERLAVVVMVTNDLSVGSIASLLAERILLDALAERGSIAKVPAPRNLSRCRPSPASDDDLAAIAGIYASSYGPRQLDVQADRTLTLSSYATVNGNPSSRASSCAGMVASYPTASRNRLPLGRRRWPPLPGRAQAHRAWALRSRTPREP